MNLMQRGRAGGGLGDTEAYLILGAVGIFVVVMLAVQIFYLMTLSKCLSRISSDNRRMEPGQVWLNLIPCFNIVWLFITVSRISDSLDNEYYSRGYRPDGDFGKNLGTMYNIFNLCSAIPYIGFLFSMIGFVMWILYWVKIAGYSSVLRAVDAGEYGDDEDRPRRDKRRIDDDEEQYDDNDRLDDEDDRPSRRRR